MWRYLFSFTGRINRAKAWLAFSLVIVAEGVLSAIGRAVIWIGDLLGTDKAMVVTDDVVTVLVFVFGAALNLSLVTFAVRRMHDRGKSGWWVLGYSCAGLVCALASNALANAAYAGGDGPSNTSMWLLMGAFGIFVWLLVELLVLQGSEGPNTYGPDPLAN